MTPSQVSFVKSLDVNGTDGTIQSVLMREGLNSVPYVGVLEFLLMTMKQEKDFLVKQNTELSNRVNAL